LRKLIILLVLSVLFLLSAGFVNAQTGACCASCEACSNTCQSEADCLNLDPSACMGGVAPQRAWWPGLTCEQLGGVSDDDCAAQYSVAPTELDFGDAPDNSTNPGYNYPTVLANNGARHIINTSFVLGALIDLEQDGQPTLAADGDDTNNLPDEDGVSIPTVIIGNPLVITVTASAAGQLDAWIDYNDDGDWNEVGEQIANNQSLIPGTNTLTPITPAAGTYYARFRFSSVGGLTPAGLALDGEVEDHIVVVEEQPEPSVPEFTGMGNIIAIVLLAIAALLFLYVRKKK